jgi:hypothetical protein
VPLGNNNSQEDWLRIKNRANTIKRNRLVCLNGFFKDDFIQTKVNSLCLLTIPNYWYIVVFSSIETNSRSFIAIPKIRYV